MLEDLKITVCLQNKALKTNSLIKLTWGNVSAIDRASGLIVIKPSGVDYDDLTPADMVVVNLNGEVVDGKLKPSSDTPTHIELYKNFEGIGGITHTHSTFSTAWAQAGRSIPLYGTTHADAFCGDVPCTRGLEPDEVGSEYEANTGKVIVQTFSTENYQAVPAVLVKNHGAFTWGKTAEEAVQNAVILEEVAKIAYLTETLSPSVQPAPKYLTQYHYLRKHGKNARYGQR